jgi:hypothetical protein
MQTDSMQAASDGVYHHNHIIITESDSYSWYSSYTGGLSHVDYRALFKLLSCKQNNHKIRFMMRLNLPAKCKQHANNAKEITIFNIFIVLIVPPAETNKLNVSLVMYFY